MTTIETLDDLDNLPIGTVLRSARGYIAVRIEEVTHPHRGGVWRWQITGVFGSARLYDTGLPATVLHDPTQPAPAGVTDREAIALLIHHGRHVCRDCPGIPSINDEATAQAILDLLPGRTVAQVKAEALREAAADRSLRLSGHGGIGIVLLRARADGLEREDKR